MSEVRSSVASTGASVASAVTTAKSAIAELQSSLDAQRSAQEQYANQREAIEKRITEIEEQERALGKRGSCNVGRIGSVGSGAPRTREGS
jgi:chromosome segregation ATPase